MNRKRAKRILAYLLVFVLFMSTGGSYLVSADENLQLQETSEEILNVEDGQSGEEQEEESESSQEDAASENSGDQQEGQESGDGQNQEDTQDSDNQETTEDSEGAEDPQEDGTSEDSQEQENSEQTDETTVEEESQNSQEDGADAQTTPQEQDIFQEEEATETVVSWSWEENASDVVYSQENERWELILSEEDREALTQKSLEEMLPKAIEGFVEEEKTKISVEWNLDETSVLKETEEYTAKAQLPQPYVVSQDSTPLEITAVTDEPQPLADGSAFDEYLVSSVSPKGTTINLFDYWTSDNRTDPENTADNDKGINAGHQLHFNSGASSENKAINSWTGTANPRTGMVSSLLEDGYPSLKNGWVSSEGKNSGDTRVFQESLDYLFDDSQVAGKQAFMDVKGLLQVTKDGYYYYDATEEAYDQRAGGNYAYFDEKSNSFKLYNTWAVYPVNSKVSPNGQFFPFNPASKVFNIGDGQLVQKNISPAKDSGMNHHFGLSMTSRFIQVEGGTNNGNDVTYKFSGDDDVWIYIDDVLVADLGGIHDRASVEINFKTGKVIINENEYGAETLEDIFKAALGKDFNANVFSNGTFKDNSYHTLNFFYLERGAGDSNMSLKYNLVTVPESDIIKVDQVGKAVPGAEFQLIATNENYEYNEESKVIATGVTNTDGTFALTDEDGFLVSLNQLYTSGNRYFVLKEVKVPAGYRVLGDIHLYLYDPDPGGNKKPVLLSANPWDTGSYAGAKVNVKAETTVTDIRNEPHDLSQGGLMFGVVMKYIGGENGDLANENDWRPVSGSPLKGWKVWDKSDRATIIQAAQVGNYTFSLTASGSYESEIDQLPGDIKKYYYMQDKPTSSNVEYTTAYFYTEADTLEKATADNTVRIESDDFEREFAATIYVPNIENHLYVQKFDDDKRTPLTGAEFSLYEEDQVENGTLKEGATPYDTVTTKDHTDIYDISGGAMFPSNSKEHPLITGKTYYLKETTAPEGYTANETLVKIVVDNTGVYADAGTAEDGISVERGVGRLVHSMIQFAPDDSVNATLHDIKATPQSGTYQSGKWNWENASDKDELHLSYSDNPDDYEYGSNSAGTAATAVFETGWSRLYIQQCLKHNGSVTTSKEDLGDQDLTGLFSALTNVQVINKAVGNLQISKTVVNSDNESSINPDDQEFNFALTLKKNNVPYTETIKITRDGNEEDLTYDSEKGCYSFTLKNNKSISVLNLPVGLEFEVQEINIPTGYHPSVTVDQGQSSATNRAQGIISHKTNADGTYEGNTISVAFTNTYSYNLVTTIKGQKTLEGRNIAASDQFTFILEPDNKDPVTSDSKETTKNRVDNKQITLEKSKVQVSGDGNSVVSGFDFGTITVKQPGNYKFYIKEEVPAEKGSITYDDHISSVTFTVEEEGGVLALAKDGMVYDNSEAVSETDKTIKDKAAFTNIVVTDFKFKKIDKEENPLAGASFGIYRQICSDAHSNDLVKTDGNGKPSDSDCWELVSQATSDTDGTVHFTGIPIQNGKTYRLVEYKAPGGYVKPSGQWCLICENGKIQFRTGEGASVGNPPAVNSKDNSIMNYKATELPFAGNTGIRIFLTLGGTLMGAGGLTGLWCWRRKKRKTARG